MVVISRRTRAGDLGSFTKLPLFQGVTIAGGFISVPLYPTLS